MLRGSDSRDSRLGLAGLLRVEHGLQLRRGLETSVIGVALIKEVVGLGTQLGRKLLKHAGEQGIN